MKITLNDQCREIVPNTTIKQLLENENLPQQNIAVAINNVMVLRQEWNNRVLVENDKVLVIVAAYGG